MGRARTFDDNVVIESAMETFWTYGYANTSPAQLAEATGVATGSLYNAFTSKRELFDRALARYDRHVSELAENLLARPGSTHECLHAALRFIVDIDRSQSSPRGCMAGNTAAELAGHDPRAVVDGALAELGGIDTLVNNVGAGDVDRFGLGGFLDIGDYQWQGLFDRNLFSAVWTTRCALPSLLERRGAIVNIASINSRVPATGPVGYSEAKAALTAFESG